MFSYCFVKLNPYDVRMLLRENPTLDAVRDTLLKQRCYGAFGAEVSRKRRDRKSKNRAKMMNERMT
jgi:hypothetical protein